MKSELGFIKRILQGKGDIVEDSSIHKRGLGTGCDIDSTDIPGKRFRRFNVQPSFYTTTAVSFTFRASLFIPNVDGRHATAEWRHQCMPLFRTGSEKTAENVDSRPDDPWTQLTFKKFSKHPRALKPIDITSRSGSIRNANWTVTID